MSNAENNLSARRLLKTALITALAAVIVTVLFVLPAEYGKDPTGIGSRLGLLDLGGNDIARDQNADRADTTRRIEGTYPDIPEEFDAYEPDVLGAPFSFTHDIAFRSDRIAINLELDEEVEVKVVMQQGDSIVYAWKVDNGDVYADFHADPGDNAAAYPQGYFIRYRESETGSSSGSLVAPFDGNHGWYWLNIQDDAIRITLEVHGYYESLGEIYRGRQ